MTLRHVFVSLMLTSLSPHSFAGPRKEEAVCATQLASNYYGSFENASAYFQDVRSARGVYPEAIKVLELFPERQSLQVLDVGFGPGIELEYFSSKGHQVTGIDLSPHFSTLLSQHFQQTGAQFPHPPLLKTAGIVGFEMSAAYDLIFAGASFLHLNQEDIGPQIARYHSQLKPGGRLYVSFKLGEFGQTKADSKGRPFVYMNETVVHEMSDKLGLQIEQIEIVEGDKLGRGGVSWINITWIRERD